MGLFLLYKCLFLLESNNSAFKSMLAASQLFLDPAHSKTGKQNYEENYPVSASNAASSVCFC